jgi:beta-lactamase regulating signal transducer with metallopeptidase domain
MSALPDSALAAAVFDASVRGTFIILAALGATALMRRTSASARHLVWLAALTALMLLPLARRFVPEWRVLPAMPTAVLVSPGADPAPRLEAPLLDTSAPAALAGAPAPSSADPSTPQPFRIPTDWKTLALLAWVAGAALFALRLAYGLVRVRWMERRATELTDDEWVRLTDGLSRRLRLGRIVRLLREPAATVPMTWGIFHPVILLPGEADGWDSERRRVVLAHELAHVRRWDALTQWIAHVALVVYWFNPLVWMAVRKLREEREHACDDAVLEIGTAPADYADHLLTIVRSLGSAPGPAPAHALAMARRSQFEGRLLAILDNAVHRNGVSRAAALATSAAALACLVPLAAMRPADRAMAMAAQVEKTAEQPSSSTAARLVSRVAEAVQSVTGGRDEVETPRETAPVDASAAAKSANTLLAEQGSGTVAPAAPAAPVLLTGGPATLLQALETRLDPGLYAEIIRAAEEIGSSTDRRLVLDRLLGKADLSHDNVVAIIGATRTMQSDTDKRIVLERAVRHPNFRANPLTHVFYEAMRTFASSTDQRVVLTSLLSARRLDSACLELIFQHLQRLGSDTDERVVLAHAVRTQRIEGHARDAYLAAARSMDSDTDRRVALSALMDLDAARTSAGAALGELTDARTSLSARVETTVPAAGTGSARNSTTRSSESTEALWDSDISLELAGREIEIHAKQVVFGRGRWDIRRIRPGGSLLVEETRGGVVRRLRAVPGAGGRPVYTYTVDGRARTFDPGARSWFEAVIREFTGD